MTWRPPCDVAGASAVRAGDVRGRAVDQRAAVDGQSGLHRRRGDPRGGGRGRGRGRAGREGGVQTHVPGARYEAICLRTC